MDPTRFDTMARSLRQTPSRRATLRSALSGLSLAAVGWLAAPPVSRAKTKKKHKRRAPACPVCPVCAAPPPYCAGKNECAEVGKHHYCHQPETTPACACFIRGDTGEPFCGTPSGSGNVTSCEACTAPTVCVQLGGACVLPGFSCHLPCPHPL